jgi:hypothetical protein
MLRSVSSARQATSSAGIGHVAQGDPALLQAKAERIARSKESDYLSATGDPIRWTFERVEDIQCLIDTAFEDGTEVYWEFFEKVDKQPAKVDASEE